MAKLKIPDEFNADLEKIENFYDLFLQDILPLDNIKKEGIGKYFNPVRENRAQANRCKQVG